MEASNGEKMMTNEIADFSELGENSIQILKKIFKNYLLENAIVNYADNLQQIIQKRIQQLKLSNVNDYAVYIENSQEEKNIIDLIADQAKWHINEKEKSQQQYKLVKESLQRCEVLHSNSEDAVVIFTPEGKVTFACPTVTNILGFTLDEMLNLNLTDIIHPSTTQEVAASMQYCMENPGITVKGHLCRVKHKNGTWRWLEAHVTNLLHEPSINGLVDNFRDVTDRIEVEISSKQLQKLLNKAEAIANIGSAEIDFVTNQRTWSDAFYKILGLNKETYQPTAAGILPFIHSKDKNRFVEWLTNGLRNQVTSQQIEVTIVKENGEERDIIAFGIAEYHNDGTPIKSFAVIKDITEEKKIKTDLEVSKQVYESLFHYNTSAVFSIDLDGNFTSANKILAQKTELDVATICTLHYSKFTHEEDLALVNEHFNIAKKGQSTQYELRVITATGKVLDVFMVNIPIVVNGEVTGVFGIANDITDTKLSQKNLEKTLKDKQEILDSSIDIICTVNKEGNIVEVSKACVSTLGYEPQELIGKTYFSLVLQEDVEATIKMAKQLSSGVEIRNFENRYIRKDGTIVSMLWSAKWNEKDQIAFCIGRDFTEQRKAEALQEFERRDKEALINATDDLIWSVSKSFKLIAGNTAFINKIFELTGLHIKQGDNLLLEGYFTEKFVEFWRTLYQRCLKGEAFKEELYTPFVSNPWSEINFNPIYNANKQVVGIACYGRNITEAKNIKNKLNEERNILRSVIDNVPDYIFIKDIHHKYIVANKGTVALLNAQSEEDLLGKTIHDFLPQKIANQFTKGEMAVLKKGIVLSNFLQKIEAHNQQEASWKLITKVPLKDTKGEIIGLVGITRDVTSIQKEQEGQILTYDIIAALGRNEKIEDAFAEALKIIGTHFNFNVGEAWLLNKEKNQLEFTANWIKGQKESGFLEDYTQFFNIGEGHPGKTWQEKRLFIINDIQQNKVRRVELAKKANLHSCIGIPIIFKNEVIAAFTFFAEKNLSEEANLVSVLNQVSLQIALDSERKKSEKELVNYSHQITNILESITDGFITIDKKWMVQYWNKEAELLLGVLRKDVIGKPVWNAFPREIVLSLSENVLNVMQQGNAKSSELYYKAMDTWFDVHVYPSQDGVSIFFKDVSESKRQENLNKLEREVLELYTKNKTNLTEVITHLLNGIQQIHPEMLCSVLRIKNNCMFNWVSPHLPEAYNQLVDGLAIGIGEGSCGTAAFTKQKVVVSDIEKDVIWEKYRTIAQSFNLKACWSYPIVDNNNEVLATFGIYYTTIKEPKNAEILTIERAKNILKNLIENTIAEEAILLSNERFNIVAAATNDIVWDYDLKTGIINWNNVLINSLGYEKLETTDSWWYSKMHPDDRDRVAQKLSDHIHYGIQDWSDEYRFATQSGEFRYFQDRGHIIFDSNHIPVRMIGAMQDITLIKENEIALTKLNAALEKRAEELAMSNTELERFAYVASHDLQEPLRMVSSFLQLLQKRYAANLDHKANEYIHFAVDGAERMKRLIMDMLEYSRVNTSKDNREEVDMMEVMNEVKLNLASSIAQTAAIVQFDQLPTIKAVRSQMIQLLQNLVGNAIKYKKPDIKPHIQISSVEDAKEWQFYVKDNGIGIEERFYEKIFVIFQRLHNKSAYSGTGIGLAICKKIVERHHGKISVTSTIGEGSIFIFSIRK